MHSDIWVAAQMGDEFDFEPFAWVTPYIANHVIPPLRTPLQTTLGLGCEIDLCYPPICSIANSF